MDVVKQLETMSTVELVALDATILHCLRGTYDTEWEHGPHSQVYTVFRCMKLDLEDGVSPMPMYSRAMLLSSLKWEATQGLARRVYANVLSAAIDPGVDMTMLEAGETHE